MSGLEKELLWQINKNLEEISAKFDKVISLLEFSKKRELEKFKEEVIGRSMIRKEIYNLCDGTKTVQDLAERLEKSLPHISKELATLEQAGLLMVKEVGRKRYYEKVI